MNTKTKRSIKWVVNKKNQFKHAGIHLIAELWYGKIIENEKELKEILTEAVRKANCIPLKTAIHKFEPQGITGVVLLAESHLSLHSWPEYNYIAIDIFTCGDRAVPKKALDYLKKELAPKRVEIQKIERGII